jgi:predicted metal-binding protein
VTEIKKDFMPVYQREKAFEAQIQQDLGTLVAKIEKIDGVDRAAILPAKDIIVDEKVRWKCIYPLCFGYGTSAVCPPHTPPVDECERVIHSFRYAIVFQLGVPVEDFTGEDWATKAGKHFVLNNRACNQAEAWANSMGYRQAVSFQGGPCTGLITGPCTGLRLGTERASGSGDTVGTCAVLRGKGCRNFLKVRPAMEAMAIDVIGTIQSLGWDVVYIGGSTNNPADIPCASTVGLLLVV